MRLSQFILDNLDAILQQWEDFARSLGSGRFMTIDALRNDAERMLRFVAADIETDQTRNEQSAKAKGHGPELPAGQLSAAHEHGIGRAVERFSLVELVSEYRALRASVTRMWIDAAPVGVETVEELIRFNEAVDQILAEGVSRFTERIDHDADLFTASMGHDLSNPVNTISMSAAVLSKSSNLSASERSAATRISHAVGRLSGMLVELRDFTRTRLGGLVRINPEPRDVGSIVRNVVDELAAVYADRHLSVRTTGNLVANIDEKRIAQLVSNLVANALQHGPRDTDVTVITSGDADCVTIEVHNTGPAIDPRKLKTLFDPLSASPRHGDEARLGLGLYIAQQIVLAHHGTIDVMSGDATGTRFTVRMPRVPAKDADLGR
jgi:signal transduction histidine kinase